MWPCNALCMGLCLQTEACLIIFAESKLGTVMAKLILCHHPGVIHTPSGPFSHYWSQLLFKSTCIWLDRKCIDSNFNLPTSWHSAVCWICNSLFQGSILITWRINCSRLCQFRLSFLIRTWSYITRVLIRKTQIIVNSCVLLACYIHLLKYVWLDFRFPAMESTCTTTV